MAPASFAAERKDWRRAALALSRGPTVGRLLPVCWPLQTIAMGWALYSFATRPHVRAKTPHRTWSPGLSDAA